MSTQTTPTPAAPATATTTATPAITGKEVALGLLKLASFAYTAYRASTHAKQQKQAAALSASVTRSSDHASMASVDPNALLNMGLQHMRNMNRFMVK